MQNNFDWPDGFDRTPPSDRSSYPGGFEVSQHRSFKSLMDELEKVDAYNIEVHTHAEHKTKSPHQPYANADPDDPSVVVYFERDGQGYAIPCDRWDNLRDNARCIAKYLGAKRAINRYGIATVDTEMSTQALPSGEEEAVAVPQDPHDILGVSQDAEPAAIKGAFRGMVKEAHNDSGDRTDLDVSDLKEARDALLEQ